MAAQNQHYVPKFVLRQFLSDQGGERVHVYDKHTDRAFVTSIKNIMAERRFNEFVFDDDYIASFEPIACGAEDQVFPAYREVIEQRRLSDNPMQKAGLAVFLAFQLLRTKGQRDQWLAMEEEVVRLIEGSGGRMQDLQGWEDWQPATEDSLKHEHLTFLQRNIGDFARIIGAKDFLLMEPAPGSSFYLADNPVVRANSHVSELASTLGLACDGIEIYMPLSADLLLCAWCPSLLQELRAGLERAKRGCEAEALQRLQRGDLSAEGMKSMLGDLSARTQPLEELLTCAAEGRPASSATANMDYYNSLQASFSYRYVISREGNFALARQMNRKNPHLRRGHRLKAA